MKKNITSGPGAEAGIFTVSNKNYPYGSAR